MSFKLFLIAVVLLMLGVCYEALPTEKDDALVEDASPVASNTDDNPEREEYSEYSNEFDDAEDENFDEMDDADDAQDTEDSNIDQSKIEIPYDGLIEKDSEDPRRPINPWPPNRRRPGSGRKYAGRFGGGRYAGRYRGGRYTGRFGGGRYAGRFGGGRYAGRFGGGRRYAAAVRRTWPPNKRKPGSGRRYAGRFGGSRYSRGRWA